MYEGEYDDGVLCVTTPRDQPLLTEVSYCIVILIYYLFDLIHVSNIGR